ncbi:hypothetical protein C7M84_023433 [Penaeus vannamei]|uniref:Uncharacterized protein n=1 Tax=Penaeus vannamei TaxID=6689 RepID=A0A423U3V2_PENVA|nr:hypothetical protein C7M84_023433 [Penaeus vannamei]
MAVMQGARDYPHDIRDIKGLTTLFPFFFSTEPPGNYVELSGHRCDVRFTKLESPAPLHIPACHEIQESRTEASTSQPSRCISPVHVAESAVVEPRSGRFLSANVSCFVPTNAHLALIEGSTSRLTVPRTFVAVHDRRSSVWVMNPYPKPRKVSPGTVIGYAEFLEPDDITPVGADVAVLNTTTEVHTSSDPAPGLRQNPSSTLDVDPLGDNDSPSEGEFLDDEFDSFDACLNFGYQDSEFFVFPDTLALDKARQQDISKVASAGRDTPPDQLEHHDPEPPDQLEHHDPELEPPDHDDPPEPPDQLALQMILSLQTSLNIMILSSLNIMILSLEHPEPPDQLDDPEPPDQLEHHDPEPQISLNIMILSQNLSLQTSLNTMILSQNWSLPTSLRMTQISPPWTLER